MSAESALRWGVIGPGGIAHKVVRYGIHRAGHRVVAVASRSLEKAQAFAAKHDIPNVCTSYDELISRTDIDAIYIPLPSLLHKEWCIKAAQAKKHILVEKPVGRDTDEVREIIAACEANGVVFMDGTFWVHHPRTAEIKKTIESGELGTIRSVVSRFSYPGHTMDPKSEIRLNTNLEATGVLGDLGWYNIRYSLFVFGYELPVEVVGHIVERHPETGAARIFVGIMKWTDGRTSTFEVSFLATDIQRIDITGLDKSLWMDDFVLPFDGTVNFFPSPEEFQPATTATYYVSAGIGKAEERKAFVGDVIQEQCMIQDFADCVAGRKSAKTFSDETLKVHQVIDAIWTSALNNGTPVRL
ncbi:putative AX110P protein [Polychytrium aggregatum]|uniref:putative AX110P protein n=1 Tax=Polychytrium aggregatum TaxID=110093 RepID=UPI0022FDF9CD|nr:putative AX110P protein [Polychytrium aggregatum]KAI9205143.1 putative AX110P protein [Polychytrium aggregatum]